MKTKIITAGAVAIGIIAGCAGLPKMTTSENIVWLEQGWSNNDRKEFHHTSQGSMTLPLPYEWFAALEQPGLSLFGEKGLIIENGYLSRLGFISGEITPYNQAGLPVGFSVDYNVVNPAISTKPFNAIGLTCAACHTGQMNITKGTNENKVVTSVRYDGGPAVTDIESLTKVLGLSLIETYLSEPRFDRFSQRILGVTNTDKNSAILKAELKHTLKNLAKNLVGPAAVKSKGTDLKDLKSSKETEFSEAIGDIKEIIDDKAKQKTTKAGFTRLDALNSIGNTVFGSDTDNLNNIATKQAPVNFPHIWNTSWFLWVQYDASIMAPMIRNAGEAMGVGAYVNMHASSPDTFDSSVKLDNLHWMEELLAGKIQPTKEAGFGGLQHPEWEESIFGGINKEKHAKGAKLYAELCQGCHLPPVDNEKFWSEKYWTKPNKAGLSLLNLPIVDLDYLGTDPQQAIVLQKRTVDTRGVGFDTQIWFEDVSKVFEKGPVYFGGDDINSNCNTMTIKDGKAESFALSLGAAVQEVNDYWYKKNNTSQAKQDEMNGYRINCLRAPNAYKARPLNGIWATAPFLHNGAVPNIYDLLSPVSERPNEFYLGSLDYDTMKMGYKSDEDYFKLDTSIKGNSNKGHEFSNKKGKGVIGRLLSETERYELIEYLKDIKTVN